MVGLYSFMAFRDGEVIAVTLATPGKTDLFKALRDTGAVADFGHYRHLDLDVDSPTHGFHLFQKGKVKLVHIPSGAK
jgi:hypothetical protein